MSSGVYLSRFSRRHGCPRFPFLLRLLLELTNVFGIPSHRARQDRDLRSHLYFQPVNLVFEDPPSKVNGFKEGVEAPLHLLEEN